MIPDQWYVVMDSTQIRDQPVGVVRMGEKLVFWRDSSRKVVCLRDKCAHRGAALCLGKVTGDHLQCPFHGLEYSSSGKVTVIPANGKNTLVPDRFQVLGYPTHEAHGLVWIWWGENHLKICRLPIFLKILMTVYRLAGLMIIGRLITLGSSKTSLTPPISLLSITIPSDEEIAPLLMVL